MKLLSLKILTILAIIVKVFYLILIMLKLLILIIIHNCSYGIQVTSERSVVGKSLMKVCSAARSIICYNANLFFEKIRVRNNSLLSKVNKTSSNWCNLLLFYIIL